MDIRILEKSIIWQRSYNLVISVYRILGNMPPEEKYGLTSQIKRAAISIILNVAEGKFRSSRQDFARFLSISKGSCGELITALRLAKDFGYIKQIDSESLTTQTFEIARMLQSSITTLKTPHP